MIYPLRADDRAHKPLMKRVGDDPAQLREYDYVKWNGEYYIRTGWGQEAGRVKTEREARLFCAYARDCMSYDGRIITMGMTLQEWLDAKYENERIVTVSQNKEAAALWGVTPGVALGVLIEEYQAGRLPLWMTRKEWRDWLMSDHIY
jgi:hypothetical protein